MGALFALDTDGTRILAKYYGDFCPNAADQAALEHKVYRKTRAASARSEADVAMLDNVVAIFRATSDIKFFVVGDASENELILTSVLDALYDSLSILMRGAADRRNILDNLDVCMLVMDEIVASGLIFETDPQAVAARVLMRGVEGGSVPITDLTISQAMAAAKDQLLKSVATRDPY